MTYFEQFDIINQTERSDKVRGFKHTLIKDTKHASVPTQLPIRADKRSAGYDFFSKETVVIQPKESHLFWTDVSSYMLDDEVLYLHVRSSVGIKKGLILKNGTGVIDASYEGNIGICLLNLSNEPVTIELGERIAQGCFHKYLVADDDKTLHNEREGGFGSSNR